MIVKIYIIVLFATLIKIIAAQQECGYSACHKTDPKKLNIHLIPNSHSDVGWMKTANDYYIIDSNIVITNVVNSLQLSPNRKYSQVEMFHFHRWWTEQNSTVKSVVRKLVTDGQLVFTNGGWTVNDEGAAHYNDIIDQLTLGLKFLDKEFGECGRPKASWQGDPFGASKEMASLYAMMGFDGHTVNRGPLPKGEYIWIGSKDLNTQIFTTVMHNHHRSPDGFEFDREDNVTDENIENKTKQLIELSMKWNNDYGNTNQVLIPMGRDFKYKKAERWYSNLDKLIKEIKENHKDIDIFYSVPHCYIQEVNRMNRTWNVREVDYLNYWVGYYSNRPTLKRQTKVANNYLQASKQLDVLSRLNPNTTRAYLDESRNEVAVMTHHDAITGTSPQYTIDDFVSRLNNSVIASRAVLEKAYKQLQQKPEHIFCPNLDISECSITESEDRIAVTIYNPIARPYSKYIRVPVGSDDYEVYDNNCLRVMNTVLAPISESIASIPERNSKATHELVFRVNLPTLGFVTYFIRKIHSFKSEKSLKNKIQENHSSIQLKGNSFSLQIEEKTGELKSLTMNGRSHSLKQSFKWYKSMVRNNFREESEIYQFCPDGSARDFDEPKLLSKFSSDSYHEIHQKFGEYISQTVRTYEDEDYIEFDWSVGPIPIDDDIGKEIVIRFDSSLKNEKKLFTDANGRQMIERVFDPNSIGCNYSENKISGNYHPIYSTAYIRDNKEGLQMSVLNDRTQGGSSLTEGSLELMIQRRLTKGGSEKRYKFDDIGVDGKGIVVRGKHYLLFKPINESAKYVKDLSRRLLLEPIISFAKYDSSETDYRSKHLTLFSGLNNPLPENIHLLTLENWKNNQILIRLENIYENSDNILYNSPLTKGLDLNIKELFKTFKVSDIVETNLVANQLLSESKRFQWNSNQSLGTELINNEIINGSVIHLLPQQIRTFILTVEDNVLPLNKCSAKWVNGSIDKIPTEGLIIGYDSDKTPFYICRHTISGDLNIGKAKSKDGCDLGFRINKTEIIKENFEILVAENVEWIPRHGTDPLPENALLSGYKLNGQPIYIGRCAMTDRNNETQVIGKISNYFNSTTYVSDKNESQIIGEIFNYYEYQSLSDCINHEVLVC